jgi:hypothetical protein
MDTTGLPPQPGEERWRFIDDLKAPMWTRHAWEKRSAGADQIDISSGVRLVRAFPDPQGRLDTAYDDITRFLTAGDVLEHDHGYPIEAGLDASLEAEAYRVDVSGERCGITAADTEGVRRGIFHLEDLMLAARGPFLLLGTIVRKPFIKRRISRCFFGPIKRPPRMRDELMDEENYYPEEYLNRLAHEGVNGLWLTVTFHDLCRTRFTPDAGQDAPRRLAKLRQTVTACLRYGIRTYIFCIEPRYWDADRPVPAGHPELAGSTAYGGRQCFCPCSDTADAYLYESVHSIFATVPDLGGLINITHGERPTTCLSAVSALDEGRIDCPRCSQKKPWEILHASLSAMERGMHAAAPEAELISWLYMPYGRGACRDDLADWVYEIPAHTPDGVILQFNLETGVTRTDFGRQLTGGDYWLSTPGPSHRFDRIAATGRSSKTSIAAKIQTGCSHELATVPYLPVPSLLYRKFAGMRRLGVSHTMLCWYFGNYPGLMNKAAGELSFEPFAEDEDAFLLRLARVTWGASNASKVAQAWKWFAKGYEQYPLTNLFQYYGPMHDGVVWPLLLKPEDAPLSPTWLLGSPVTRKPWPPSGDRIGECFGEAFTLSEVVELARRMSSDWASGMNILRSLAPEYRDDPERLLDIGVAEALTIQLRSGYNILRFYEGREEMIRAQGMERLGMLERLVGIIEEEAELSGELLHLCAQDSRLGFHSEAEGYKYFPEKIRWRMSQLAGALTKDAPELEAAIRSGEPLFPEYSGERPTGAMARCLRTDGSAWSAATFRLPADAAWDNGAVTWTSCFDTEAIYVAVLAGTDVSRVLVKVEPRRLWPCRHFVYAPGAPWRQEQPDHVSPQSIEGRTGEVNSEQYTLVRIPLARIPLDSPDLHPIRIDVQVTKPGSGTHCWRPSNPSTSRLRLGADNPADLGWLIFEG